MTALIIPLVYGVLTHNYAKMEIHMDHLIHLVKYFKQDMIAGKKIYARNVLVRVVYLMRRRICVLEVSIKKTLEGMGIKY